ncbi:MAG: hypothetical protein ACK526_19730 [Planctomyces sp.]
MLKNIMVFIPAVVCGFRLKYRAKCQMLTQTEATVVPRGRTAVKDLSSMRIVCQTFCILLAVCLNLTSVNALETRSVAEFGADGAGDDTDSIQQAIDFAVANPCRLVFPAPSYTVSKTLRIRNPGNTRASGPVLAGRGAEATSIQFKGKSGPLFQVTGVIAAGQFLHDLGFERLKLVGSFRDSDEHAIQLMGCYAPSIHQLAVTGFGGDGIRVNGDLSIDTNPDFTATIFLSVEGCHIYRIGGLGFRDDHPIGCPGVSIRRSVFNLCGGGGALIRSAAFEVEQTAFSGCGCSSETEVKNAEAIGLQVKTPGGSLSRGLLRACEFDTNRGEHLRMDNFAMARLENNRFIYDDRYHIGVLCPPVGANMAPQGPESVLTEIVIDGLFHRVDGKGKGRRNPVVEFSECRRNID